MFTITSALMRVRTAERISAAELPARFGATSSISFGSTNAANQLGALAGV